MKDLLTLLEKLYSHREYAISRRFFPLVVISVFAVVATVMGLADLSPTPLFKTVVLSITSALVVGLLVSAAVVLPHESRWIKNAKRLIEDCDFEKAERSLSSPPPFNGFASRIKRLEMLVYLKMEIGDLVAAHSYLLDAEQKTLLPDERVSLQMIRATLMFKAGNYEAFEKVLGEIPSELPKSGALRFRDALLKSHLHELKGQFSEARMLLEEACEIAPEPKLVAVAFNNLARLEDMQGNDTNAQSYYERAWQVLRTNPMPKLYPVAGHNLLIKYGRSGAVDKALSLLSEYRQMVSRSNTQQYLQFLNDQVHLARQLRNRSMLMDSYENSKQILMKQVDTHQCLALMVNELRMRFNDGLPFAGQLNATVTLLGEIRDLKPEDRFQALRELLGVLKQCDARSDGKDFGDVQKRLIVDLLAMEEEIDVQLRDTSPVLPIVRDVWYGHKLEICRLKIELSAPRLSRSDLNNIFALLHQRRQVWADKGNPVGELDALICICNEFVAHAGQRDQQFTSDYGAMAQQALKEAVQVLERYWPHPSVHRHALGVAYFCWRLANDRDGAERWLLRFEELGHSLTHFAKWFREWHAGVRGWLKSLDQARGITGLVSMKGLADWDKEQRPVKTTTFDPQPNPDNPGVR